jgi:hypothetical protein
MELAISDIFNFLVDVALPPLPEITDTSLRRLVFTHPSIHAGSRANTGTDFENQEEN